MSELPLHHFSDREALRQYAEDGRESPWSRARVNETLSLLAQHAVTGFCIACDQAVIFQFDAANRAAAATGEEPDWREQTTCPVCRLNSRLRLAWHAFRMHGHDPAVRVYATERVTPFFGFLQRRCGSALGSEYIPGLPFGSLIRVGSVLATNQDLTRLSHADAMFDAIFCLEVLEHVPDYRTALAELRRVLRPGGQLILSAPFLLHADRTLVRARFRDGEVEHIEPPEYHGDPVSGGVLCFYHFGWSLLDDLKGAGFCDARVVCGRSDQFGYFGWGNIVIDATA